MSHKGTSPTWSWHIGESHCQRAVFSKSRKFLVDPEGSSTWAALRWWMGLCKTSHWFDVQARGIYAKADPENWNLIPQTCRPENAQSFAGQHAKRSTSWFLFDEASEVPDAIWETAKGGLTDGEPMWFAWGQPVRNSGMFHKVCFGSEKERWIRRSVDSRNSRFTNKALIEQWIQDYGLDSDFVQVRVLGLPPSADELQFIDSRRVFGARRREAQSLRDDPLIAGFDVSGGGSGWNVIRFRRGFDARSIPPIRIPGERGRDRSVLVAIAAEVLREKKPQAMFVDSAFGEPIVERLRTLGFKQVLEVNFGGHSADIHQLNQRAYMWHQMKDWLQRGAIPDDENLHAQVCGPGYHINQAGRLVIESKKDMIDRGVASPDDADALALTFAQPVAPLRAPTPAPRLNTTTIWKDQKNGARTGRKKNIAHAPCAWMVHPPRPAGAGDKCALLALIALVFFDVAVL
jgi:hypothetical protein